MARPKTRLIMPEEAPPKSKKTLDDSTIELRRVYEKENIENTILCWRVPSYSRLKTDIIYTRMFQGTDLKCFFRLFRSRSKLFLCFSSNQVIGENFEYLLVDEVDFKSLKTVLNETVNNLYFSQIPERSFTGPDSNFLKDDVLTISFKYPSDHYFKRYENKVDEDIVLADVDELSYDLKVMYLKAIHADFLIHVGDYSFRAHKFVLSARSKYFFSLFKKGKSVESVTLKDALPLALHEVLLYIYSGEFMIVNIVVMLEMHDIAEAFEMGDVARQCIQYFSACVDDFSNKVLSRSVRDIMEEYSATNRAEKLKEEDQEVKKDKVNSDGK